MYRHSISKAIAYTPEDLILFRESPFAAWMERLSLENPSHRIAPDPQPLKQRRVRPYFGPVDALESQRLNWEAFVSGIAVGSKPDAQVRVDFAQQLRARGKNVVSIAKYATEAERRSATLDAMRGGAEYIADAQLALGPLACRADMLIRSKGISELGSHFYLPADTSGAAGRHTTHHLCFAADLLESLQGVLPFQLLVMSPGADITCLPTSDHIERFRDLKYQFMTAQLSFRKHRMPDPALSSHFGRWSHCAREVLSRRSRGYDHGIVAPAFGSAQQHSKTCPGDGTAQTETTSNKNATASRRGLVAALNRAVSRSATKPSNDQCLIDLDVTCPSKVAVPTKTRQTKRQCG